MNEFTPAPIQVIDDLETLKILADPLRNHILEVLAPEPQTVNAIAEKLGQDASRLYYHVKLLEKHGLVQVVDTRVVANIIEKFYWITAYDFEIKHGLYSFGTPEGNENITTMFTSFIDTTRADLVRSLAARQRQIDLGAEIHPRQVTVNRVVVRITDELAETFHKRLKALFHEFEGAGKETAGTEGTQEYALTGVLYPTFYYPDTPTEKAQDS